MGGGDIKISSRFMFKLGPVRTTAIHTRTTTLVTMGTETTFLVADFCIDFSTVVA